MLTEDYKGYKNALSKLNLLTFAERRENPCTKNAKTKHMFPRNEKHHGMMTRNEESFQEQFANTDRLKKITKKICYTAYSSKK